MIKPSHKTLTFLVIALIGTVVISIGIWWVNQNNQPPVVTINTNQPTNQPTASGTVTPPTKTDCTDELDTTCWSTYVNEEFGFSFKFPWGWEGKYYKEIDSIIISQDILPEILPNSDKPYAVVIKISSMNKLPENNSQTIVSESDEITTVSYYSDLLGSYLKTYYFEIKKGYVVISGADEKVIHKLLTTMSKMP